MGYRFPGLKFVAFTLVCIAFSVWIAAVIGNLSLESRTTYAAEFSDVQGLLVNDNVKISGVTVGKVTGIEVQPGGTALVRFAVRDDIVLRDDAVVSVRWRDVFGLRFLYLEPGSGAAVAAGHTYPDEQTRAPVDLNVLLDRLVPVMQALDPEVQNQVLQALQEALVGREDEVRDLIRQGASLTQAIASRDDEIERLLVNAADTLDAYAQREQDLRALLASFAEVSETIAARNDELVSAVVRIGDAQEELDRLLDANDDELRLALDELEDLATILALQRDRIAPLLSTSPSGLVTYHRISRLGQWFNIRAVGVSADYETATTERGASLPEQRSSHRSGPGAFLGSGASTDRGDR
jgi:phospholipid/cholesterol/gamma-HCH transport system substrate-binding protein